MIKVDIICSLDDNDLRLTAAPRLAVINRMREWAKGMGDKVTNASFSEIAGVVLVSYETRGEEDAFVSTGEEPPAAPAAA